MNTTLKVIVIGALAAAGITAAALLLTCHKEEIPLIEIVSVPEEMLENLAAVSVQVSSDLSGISSVSFSHDTRYIATGSRDGVVRIWEATAGKQIRMLSLGESSINALAFSPETLACGSDDGMIYICEIKTGKVVYTLQTAAVSALEYGKNGKEIIALLKNGDVQYWDSGKGTLLRSVSSELRDFSAAALAGSGSQILSAAGSSAQLTPHRTQFSTTPGEILSLALSGDGTRAAAADAQGNISIYDTATGALLKTLTSADKNYALALSADNRILLSGSDSGTTRLWDIEAGIEVVQYISKENEWACKAAQSGFYNASSHGDELLTVYAGDDSYNLSKFSEKLFRPDVVLSVIKGLLHGTPVDLPPDTLQTIIADIKENPLPEVQILESTPQRVNSWKATLKVKIIVHEGGAGIIKVHNRNVLTGLFSNIQEQLERTYTEKGNVCYEVSLDVPVSAGSNPIEVAVYNGKNSVQSESAKVDIVSSWSGTNSKPVLHVVLVAIKEYQNPKFNLTYTIDDAKALEELFIAQKNGNLYGDVKVHTLYNNAVTKAGFYNFFAKELVPQVNPGDMLVFFFSGHGDVRDGDFYFVPWDSEGIDTSMEKNIARADIVGNILKLNVKDALILLDACKSGQILEMESPVGRLLRDLEQKAIIAAAEGDQSAQELLELGHGVFTWAILKGFGGEAANGSGRHIGAQELASYVEEAVPAKMEEFASSSNASKGFQIEDVKSQKPTAIMPARDFRLVDRRLNPGKIVIRSADAGRVSIVSTTSVSGEEFDITAGTTIIKERKEDTYRVSIVYSNGYVDPQQVLMVENEEEYPVNFTYKVPPLQVKKTPKEEATILVASGTAHYEKREYDPAIRDYTEAIRIYPSFYEAFYNRGDAYDEKRQYDQAIADYTEAIRLNSSSEKAYIQRGIVYQKKGNYDQAIADFTKAAQINPQYATAFYNRAYVYFYQKKDYDKAIADSTEAIKIRPAYAEAFFLRGNVHYAKNNYDQALADLSQAIQLRNSYTEALYTRGNVYRDRKEYDKAITDYTAAIRLKNNYAEAFYNRANVYQELKEYDKAIADYSSAINVRSSYADAFNNRGTVYLVQKLYDQAIADFDAALKINPNHPLALANRRKALLTKQ
jgi:tetratricopeptide (TPR) repeat protein/WD40 repeat protein